MDRLLANETVNATEVGEGPPLVLLHSLLADRTSFDAIVPALSKFFRVVIPELPGFGQSHAVHGGLAAVADRMAEAVRDCAGSERAIVLGNGYGGFVALQLAIRFPSLVGRLILADCGAAFTEPGREAFRSMARVAASNGLSAVADVAIRRLFAPDFQNSNPNLMRSRREAFLRTDQAVFQATCKALAELDLRAHLGNVVAPVLVLVGEHDEATPPSMSYELAAGLPNAHLIVLEGCAHVPQLQKPKAFLDSIGSFLGTA
jgi:3-oxoadipate enol-lactonase